MYQVDDEQSTAEYLEQLPKKVVDRPPSSGQRPPRPFATNIAQEELFLMDSYYKELMKKERAAFERVLASKLNV